MRRRPLAISSAPRVPKMLNTIPATTQPPSLTNARSEAVRLTPRAYVCGLSAVVRPET